MRVLAAIPHYFGPRAAAPDGARHGSVGGDPRPRVDALANCVAALHQLYGPAQRVIDIATRLAPPVNGRTAGVVDVHERSDARPPTAGGGRR